MENRSGSRSGSIARRLKRIGLLSCSAVLLSAATQGPRATEEFPAVAKEGYYEGVVALPDPGNFWTGMKITDEPCFARVRKHEPGSLSVESNFSEEEVIVRTDNMPGESFYMGRFGDNQALVLQLQPPLGTAVSMTHTSFDKNGVLNYGGKGKGSFTRECIM